MDKKTVTPSLITTDTSLSINAGADCNERIDLSFPEDIETEDDKFIDIRISFPVYNRVEGEIFWLYSETTLGLEQATEILAYLFDRDLQVDKTFNVGPGNHDRLEFTCDKIREHDKEQNAPNIVEAMKMKIVRPPVKPNGKPLIAMTRLNDMAMKMIICYIGLFLEACGVETDINVGSSIGFD